MSEKGKTNFSDTDLLYTVMHIDYRSPEEVEADQKWITETTQAIINRRKERSLQKDVSVIA